MLVQREIATANDKDYAHFFVSQILGALKKGNLFYCLFHLDCSWPRSTQVQPLHLAVFFIDTGDPEWQSKQRRYSSYSDKHTLPW